MVGVPTMNRRSSVPSSVVAPPSSLSKRPAAGAENAVASKSAAASARRDKKRAVLGEIPNPGIATRATGAVGRTASAEVKRVGVASNLSSTSSSRAKSASSNRFTSSSRRDSLTKLAAPKVAPDAPSKIAAVLPAYLAPVSATALPPCPVPCHTTISQSNSGDSVSQTESMSTCDSMNSPEIEYIENDESSMLASLQRRTNDHLRIDDQIAGYNNWKIDDLANNESDDVMDVDGTNEDPQYCATLVGDIYMHLREAETKKRPLTDFMERIQKDINENMRAILVDWLVEVSEEYRLVPDTLYLTVNYVDRYLSGNEINRQRLQLLGVTCMLIAAKYEEICAPQVEEFCYITDNTYFREEVIQMETSVLKYLKFELTAPTVKCFLRRFVHAAQLSDDDPHMQLEFLANYVAELSLMDYSFLCYAPSLIAAAAVFLAKFILQPQKNPWNATLAHYTLYKPSDFCDCVKALHRLVCLGLGSNLPAIREKYSQHRYKFVAKKYCPPTIPTEFFQDAAR